MKKAISYVLLLTLLILAFTVWIGDKSPQGGAAHPDSPVVVVSEPGWGVPPPGVKKQKPHETRAANENGTINDLEIKAGCLNLAYIEVCPHPVRGFGDALSEALERWRGGDLVAALNLYGLIWHCGKLTPRNEEELFDIVVGPEHVDSALYEAFPASELTAPYREKGTAYPTTLERAGGYDVMLRHCAPVHALVDGGFRREVARQAQAGKGAARLLYTLWSPSASSAFETWVDWQVTSLDYVQQGVKQGDVAGLAAGAWGSISSSFMTSNWVSTDAFAEAALRCGVDEQAVPPRFLEIYDQDSLVPDFTLEALNRVYLSGWVEELSAHCVKPSKDAP